MAVLVADDVSRRYGETVALDGVSLTVEEGEIFGLVGPNGAGKTTLVRALTGTTVIEGRVELFGTSPQHVDRERIGLLPQSFDPPERLTVRELVEYYGGLYDDPEPTETLLKAVGVADRADTYYENLSGGQKRRLCVGTTLVNDPDLLVLDEPTTGIDPSGRRDIWSLIRTLADGGTTILLTTHYMEEAEQLADRVGLLADGQLLAIGTPGELVAAHGGDSRLLVETDDEAAAKETLAAEGYELLSDARSVAVSVPPREIGAVADALESAGVTYEGLVWRQPDLEDVYLALTGTEVDERAHGSEKAPLPGGGQ